MCRCGSGLLSVQMDLFNVRTQIARVSKEVPVLMSSPMAGVDCSDEGGDASAVTDGDIGPDVDRSCLGPRSMWWGGYESQDVSTTRGPDIYIV